MHPDLGDARKLAEFPTNAVEDRILDVSQLDFHAYFGALRGEQHPPRRRVRQKDDICDASEHVRVSVG